jgi:hypothetical protein
MPLPLPRPRQDRPRRRVEASAEPLREPPLRTYSFDPGAARQAWRQVARTRGAYAMRLDGREPGAGRLAMVALGLAAAAALLLWWTADDGSGARDRVTAAKVEVVDVGGGASPSSPTSRSPVSMLPEPQVPVPAGAPSFADASDELEPPMPRTVAERFFPPGTLEGHAKALRRLPHASTDRAPLGGIGPQGIHVDRIAMGTRIQGGACMGPTGNFSVRDDDHAHVCFRVVHPRIEQRVVVRWERGGRLVRRTVVSIDDSHAYRTRATLPLRRKFQGEWTVRIMSTDGIELAAQTFLVGP